MKRSYLYDLPIHGAFLVLGMLCNVLLIRFINLEFDSSTFANYSFGIVVGLTIASISDFGLKYIYFRSETRYSWKLISLFKFIFSVSAFIPTSIFFGVETLPFLIFTSAYSIIPYIYFQSKNRFYFYSGIIFLSRLAAIIIVKQSNDYKSIVYIQSIVIWAFTISTFIFSKDDLFKIKKLYEQSSGLFKEIKSLSLFHIFSNIEANFHTFLANRLLPIHSFEIYMVADRIGGYLKQILIVLLEFLFPKGNSVPYKKIEKYLIIGISIFGLVIYKSDLIIYITGLDHNEDLKNLILIYVVYIIIIAKMNFSYFNKMLLQKKDKRNTEIICYSILMKFILIYLTSMFLDFYGVMIGLIITEIYQGLLRKKYLDNAPSF